MKNKSSILKDHEDKMKHLIREGTEDEINSLNKKTITTLYPTKYTCRSCGSVVSMTKDGLCGLCE